MTGAFGGCFVARRVVSCLVGVQAYAVEVVAGVLAVKLAVAVRDVALDECGEPAKNNRSILDPPRILVCGSLPTEGGPDHRTGPRTKAALASV